MGLLKVFAAGLGVGLVFLALRSAIRTLVLPRAARDGVTRWIWLVVRAFFALSVKGKRSYAQSEQLMAYYAPVALIMMVPAWFVMIWIGYAGLFMALGAESLYTALRDSGSSLLTLGFESVNTLPLSLLAFTEATIGLILVGLLISYLPTMYTAFSRREAAVTLLEVRAGNPPSALQMLLRYHRIHGLDRLSDEWQRWETWFADIQESHTSLVALVFFRSPDPTHSWVTASGAVLDTASIRLSALDMPSDAQAALCIRGGYLALRSIADFFELPYPPDPKPDDPISISRAEFDGLLAELEKEGLPLKPDRERAWRDFNGWRVNYDAVLLGLARLTMAPPAPWSGERSADGWTAIKPPR